MKSKHVEDLLQRYLEGGLTDDERRAVDEHVAGCESCRQALAVYTDLEEALVARRGLLPPAGLTVVRVIERLGLRPARRRSWLRIPVGLPAVLSVAFIMLGVLLFAVKDVVRDLLVGVGSGLSANAPSWSEELNSALGQLTGANEIAVMAIYFGVFGLIFFTGSLMVLRFVRE